MAEPLFTEARYVIRADFFGRGTHYWRFTKDAANGWVTQRRLATRFVRADEDRALADVPPAELPHIRVVRLKPKAALPVETPTTEMDTLMLSRDLDLLALSKTDRVTASVRIPPGHPLKVGDAVCINGHALAVTEINGDLAQCSSRPQEPHGL